MHYLQGALKECEANLASLTAQQEDLQGATSKAESASASAQTQLATLQQARPAPFQGHAQHCPDLFILQRSVIHHGLCAFLFSIHALSVLRQ